LILKIIMILGAFVVIVGNLFHPLLTLAFTVVTSANVDLNKNNSIEAIELSGIQDTGDFVLKINGTTTKGRLKEGRPDGFTSS
jgi:hypothetical protein